MSARKSSRGGWLVGLLGVIGFSAILGVLLTISVAPALALASVGTQSAIGVFDSIPDGFDLTQQAQRNQIFAQSNGQNVLVATVYDQNRQEIPYDQISPYALNAAVAGEDKRFYDHGGIDISGVIRAAIGNATGSGFSGASTITQQLVKQTNIQECLEQPTDDERTACYNQAVAQTVDRKITEMRYAIALEKKYTKDEILTAYLNIANFGSATYGIEAAAERYFGIHASQLSVVQAASLIAIVQSPDTLNLTIASDKDAEATRFAANQKRRNYVLDTMLDEGYITQAQHDEAVAVQIDENFVSGGSVPQQGCRTANIDFRWACDYIVKSVPDFAFLGADLGDPAATAAERQANWDKGGYDLYTSIDLDANKVATDLLTTWTPPDAIGGNLGGTVSTIEPGTGRIRVMAENKVFDDAPIADQTDPTVTASVNINTVGNGSGGKTPGSTYKLFTLVDWLESGHGIYEVISADEGTIPISDWTNSCGPTASYTFHNDEHESGDRTVQNATWNSINGVFLRMATKLDLCDIGKIAASMGAQRADGQPLATGPAEVIGSGNNSVAMQSMADSYATIAANGLHCVPIIVDSYVGPDGVSHPGQTPQCNQVVDPDISATVAYTMAGTATNGTGTLANPRDGTPILMKTGTGSDNEVRLVAGATTTNATMVWTGYFNSKTNFNMQRFSINGVSGMYLRDRIFKGTMQFLDTRYGGSAFPTPSGKYLYGSSTNVPNVSGIGFTYDQAAAFLQAAGFQVADGGPVDSDQPVGTVASQDPAASAKAGLGSTITLYESTQNMSVIPTVTGSTLDAAKQTLTASGWPASSIDTNYVCSGGSPVQHPSNTGGSTVTAQTPGGGTLQVTGGPVTLTVTLTGSNCLPNTPVPNVVGATYAQAQAQINAAHLTVGTVTPACTTGSPSGGPTPTDHVSAQTPAGGTSVAQGSPVNLTVTLDPSHCT